MSAIAAALLQRCLTVNGSGIQVSARRARGVTEQTN
jgi:hypothetical protein